MKSLENILYKILNDILGEILKNNYQIYTQQYVRIQIIDQSSLGSKIVHIPDHSTSFRYQTETIFENYNFNELDSLINTKHPYLKRIGTRDDSGAFSSEQMVKTLASNILKSNPNDTNLQTLIRNEIFKFINLLNNKTFTTTLYMPFRSIIITENEQLYFEDYLQLRSLSEDEINVLFRDMYGHPDMFSTARTALVATYRDYVLFGDHFKSKHDIQYIEDSIQTAIYALNLSKSGPIGVDTRYYRYDEYFSSFRTGHSRKSHYRIPGSQRHISTEEIHNAKNYYDLLKTTNLSPFSLALQKLQDSENRYIVRDSVIDSVIGMESLLLNDIGNEKTRGELKYRFCINYSSLYPIEKRECAYQEAKEAYDLRSMLVHGGLSEIKSYNFLGKRYNEKDISEIINNMLRKCIIELLNNYSNDPFDKDNYWIKRILNLHNHCVEITPGAVR